MKLLERAGTRRNVAGSRKNRAAVCGRLPHSDPIRRNPAETPLMENSGKQAEFVEKRSGIVDRRIAVAPMMDDVERRDIHFQNQRL
jgi:hypothetical protein